MHGIRVHISKQSYKNNKGWVRERISGWLLFNVNHRTRCISMIWCWCQLFTHLDLFSASSQTQPSVCWNVAPFGHIILIPSQPLFSLKKYNGNIYINGEFDLIVTWFTGVTWGQILERQSSLPFPTPETAIT
jgi:hypothetical protein